MLNPALDIVVEKLVDRIADAVVMKLMDALPPQTSSHQLKDGPAMAKLLDVSLQTLERLRKAQQVPFLAVGSRNIRYEPQAVIAALAVGSAADDTDSTDQLADGPDRIGTGPKHSPLLNGGRYE